MRSHPFKKALLLAAALVFAMAATAAAQIVLDLNPAPGDQGVREEKVKPGDMKTIEVAATKGAKDIIGFEVELRLDTRQVTFKSFQASGLMAGAMAMPPQKTPEGVKISVALLGKTSPGDAGTLGQILVEFTKELGPETVIELVTGSFGSAAGTNEFPLTGGVKFFNATATAASAPSPTTPAPKPGTPYEPPECDENVRNSELKPQAENVPCDGTTGNLLFRTVCNKAPYDQVAITLPGGRMAGCFGVESITSNKVVWGIRVEGGATLYHSSMGPVALNSLKISDTRPSPTGKYTIFLDMKQSDPDARVTVRFVDHPIGGAPAGPTTGPAPKPGPVGPPTGPPPSPEEAIKSLPSALQPTFQKTLSVEQATHRAHMEAELNMLKSVRQTLEAVKNYLPKASDQEKEAIANALAFFQNGPQGPPMGPQQMGGPMGPPGGPAGPVGPPAKNVEEMVKQMIQKVDQEISRVQEELRTMGM